MLGLKYTRRQIGKDDSKIIMLSLERAISGNLNEEERQNEEKFEMALKKHSIYFKK